MVCVGYIHSTLGAKQRLQLRLLACMSVHRATRYCQFALALSLSLPNLLREREGKRRTSSYQHICTIAEPGSIKRSGLVDRGRAEICVPLLPAQVELDG